MYCRHDVVSAAIIARSIACCRKTIGVEITRFTVGQIRVESSLGVGCWTRTAGTASAATSGGIKSRAILFTCQGSGSKIEAFTGFSTQISTVANFGSIDGIISTRRRLGTTSTRIKTGAIRIAG